MKQTPLKRSKPLTRSKPLAKVGKKPAKAKVPSVAVLDDLFSRYVRRFGECQLWGVGGVVCSSQLQCSHIHSRRFTSLRWDPDNAQAVCAAHHRWQHAHPTLNTWALEEILGKDHLERLRDKFLAGNKPDRRALAQWLRDELRKVA